MKYDYYSETKNEIRSWLESLHFYNDEEGIAVKECPGFVSDEECLGDCLMEAAEPLFHSENETPFSMSPDSHERLKENVPLLLRCLEKDKNNNEKFEVRDESEADACIRYYVMREVWDQVFLRFDYNLQLASVNPGAFSGKDGMATYDEI